MSVGIVEIAEEREALEERRWESGAGRGRFWMREPGRRRVVSSGLDEVGRVGQWDYHKERGVTYLWG